MANLLDLSVLQGFLPAFVFMFVLVAVYAILQVTKVLTDNKGIHALLAIFTALIVILFPGASKVIANMTPWFILMIFFIMFILIAGQFMGMPAGSGPGTVVKMLGGEGAGWWIFILGIIIALWAVSDAYGQALLEKGAAEGGTGTVTAPGQEGGRNTATTNFRENLGAALFHPKILGLALILVIGALTVQFMTRLE